MHEHSFQNYTDYFKCVTAKGEDFAPCKQFKRAYNSLCPSEYFGCFRVSCCLISFQMNGYDASIVILFHL